MPCKHVCIGGTHAIVTYPDLYEVTHEGRVWRFEYHEWLGPTVVRKDGEPCAKQPGYRSPFWAAFETWWKTRKAIALATASEGGA